MQARLSPVAILRDDRCAVSSGGGQSKGLLARPQPLVEHRDIDEPARVAAFAEFSRALEGLDLEADDAALYRNDLRGSPHRRADEACSKMTDIDLGADRDPAGLKDAADRIARRHLH